MQKIVYISVDQLHPHPDNPRKNLGDLTELSESIKAKGVLQNLTVVPAEEGGYRIIIGHRRHAAGVQAGLDELPCVVVAMTPQEQFETMMVENVQRSDLTVYEQAEGFQMMMDMGNSVEDIASKTGFSKTTVYSRMKLMELDKKKFQKAEKRGATMTDYLKLNEIKDPALRNKVLDTIGTPDFTAKLKHAKQQEEFADFISKVKADLEAADWCQPIPEGANTYRDYDFVTSYSTYNRKEVTRPEDADTVAYFYYRRTDTDIALYKKKSETEVAAVNLDKERKDRLKEKLQDIADELNSISLRHLEMRDDFIRDFTAVNNYEMDIEAFAAKTIVWIYSDRYGSHSLDLDRLGNLLNVKVLGDRRDGYELDPESWRSRLFNNPQYALLCTVYTLLEKDGNSYNKTVWNSTILDRCPTHNKNSTLDLIYEGLVSLGYEMSEEEIQMQNGSHPLFKKTSALIEQFKKESEKNEEEK